MMRTSIIFLLLFLAATTWAEDFIGEVRLIRGTVLNAAGGLMKPMKLGSKIKKGDLIKTDDRSFVKLLMVDQSQISLGPKSEMSFEEYKVEATSRDVLLDFIKGQVAAVVTKKTSGQMRFKTKTATMGIRGTEILINHKTIQAKEVSEFALLSGIADVTDQKNETLEIGPRDRLVYIQDPVTKETRLIKERLSDDEFQLLKAPQVKEEEEFKPFMDYFDFNRPRAMGPAAAAMAAPESSGAQTVIQEVEQSPAKKNWEKNLEKLNEQLKENQKKP